MYADGCYVFITCFIIDLTDCVKMSSTSERSKERRGSYTDNAGAVVRLCIACLPDDWVLAGAGRNAVEPGVSVLNPALRGTCGDGLYFVQNGIPRPPWGNMSGRPLGMQGHSGNQARPGGEERCRYDRLTSIGPGSATVRRATLGTDRSSAPGFPGREQAVLRVTMSPVRP
jgi:hypothetical protein